MSGVAFTISPDGQVAALTDRTFDAIVAAVGGYVEPIHCGNVVLWCNEDGRMLGLPNNAVATALWWRIAPASKGPRLVGTVVVTGPNGEAIAAVPDDIAELLEAWQ